MSEVVVTAEMLDGMTAGLRAVAMAAQGLGAAAREGRDATAAASPLYFDGWVIGGPISDADIQRGQELYARYSEGFTDPAIPDTSQPYFLDLLARIDEVTEERQ